jgi:3-oxoacyl-ACP reductase-like protein
LDLDPWKVAVELCELPQDTATQRLSTLIARLPAGRWAQADSGAIADRLIELLPPSGSSKAPLAEKVQGRPEMTGSTVAMLLLCAALGVTAFIIAASREPSSLGDADAPAFSTASPPSSR